MVSPRIHRNLVGKGRGGQKAENMLACAKEKPRGFRPGLVVVLVFLFQVYQRPEVDVLRYLAFVKWPCRIVQSNGVSRTVRDDLAGLIGHS